MRTTYTIKTSIPQPTVQMATTSTFFNAGELVVNLDTSKSQAWLEDVKKLVKHPSVLFGAVIEGHITVSLSDKEAAEEFNRKWGAA